MGSNKFGFFARLWSALRGDTADPENGHGADAAPLPAPQAKTRVILPPPPLPPLRDVAEGLTTLDAALAMRPKTIPAPPVAAVPRPASTNIHVLHAPSATDFMLSARLASQSALNPPKALAPRKSRAVSSTKPLQAMNSAGVRMGNRPKPRRQVKPPRVLRPIRRSAEIIRIADHARAGKLAPGQVRRVA